MYLHVHYLAPGLFRSRLKESVGKVYRPDGEVILFCDYSEFDIPIGTEFRSLKGSKVSNDCEIRLRLINVYDQYFHAFDLVPIGWQTICQFSCEKQAVNILNLIPHGVGWSNPKQNWVTISTDIDS